MFCLVMSIITSRPVGILVLYPGLREGNNEGHIMLVKRDSYFIILLTLIRLKQLIFQGNPLIKGGPC